MNQYTRLFHIIVLLIVIALGFGSKYYSGPGRYWFNDYGAGVMYVAFFIIFFSFFFSSRKFLNRITLIVFLTTCLLEFLQLWHPHFLEIIRHTFLGGALLGTTFVWWDFPHYVLGALIGWGVMRIIYGKLNNRLNNN
ncbi:DUF2809 domain-containing protein [Calditrichota bacterium]